MLGLSVSDGILGARASGNKMLDLGLTGPLASPCLPGCSRILAAGGPGDSGLVGIHEEHVALGTELLFHFYQTGLSKELKTVGPYCQMILLKRQQCFKGFF